MTGHEIIQVHITGNKPFIMRMSWLKDRVIRPLFGKGVTRFVAASLANTGMWERSMDDGITVTVYWRPEEMHPDDVSNVLSRHEF